MSNLLFTLLNLLRLWLLGSCILPLALHWWSASSSERRRREITITRRHRVRRSSAASLDLVSTAKTYLVLPSRFLHLPMISGRQMDWPIRCRYEYGVRTICRVHLHLFCSIYLGVVIFLHFPTCRCEQLICPEPVSSMHSLKRGQCTSPSVFN